MAASTIPSTDARITGFRTGWISTRRQDGRWPVSTRSRMTKAIGASTSSWYSITGATKVASPKT